MRLTAVTAFVCAVLALHVGAHFTDPRLHSFNIGTEDDAEKEVAFTFGEHKTSCVFKYSTGEPIVVLPKQEEVEEEAEPRINFASVAKRFQGSCIERVLGFWTYQMCFGGELKQFHDADVYVLGRTSEVKLNLIMYRDGDMCEAFKPKDQPRAVDVSFGCLPNAEARPILFSVTETATCEYSVVIGTKLVCGDSTYKILDEAVAFTENPHVDDGSEDWFLEITHLDDGRVMCSAYSTEFRSAGSQLFFQSFSLEISASDSIAASVTPFSQFTARHPGRTPCSPSEVVLSSNRIENSDEFDGRLAFLKIST